GVGSRTGTGDGHDRACLWRYDAQSAGRCDAESGSRPCRTIRGAHRASLLSCGCRPRLRSRRGVASPWGPRPCAGHRTVPARGSRRSVLVAAALLPFHARLAFLRRVARRKGGIADGIDVTAIPAGAQPWIGIVFANGFVLPLEEALEADRAGDKLPHEHETAALLAIAGDAISLIVFRMPHDDHQVRRRDVGRRQRDDNLVLVVD